jgi:hypothetical protein
VFDRAGIILNDTPVAKQQARLLARQGLATDVRFRGAETGVTETGVGSCIAMFRAMGQPAAKTVITRASAAGRHCLEKVCQAISRAAQRAAMLQNKT